MKVDACSYLYSGRKIDIDILDLDYSNFHFDKDIIAAYGTSFNFYCFRFFLRMLESKCVCSQLLPS